MHKHTHSTHTHANTGFNVYKYTIKGKEVCEILIHIATAIGKLQYFEYLNQHLYFGG